MNAPWSTDLASNVGSDDALFFSGALGGPIGGSRLLIAGAPFLYNPAAGNLLLRIQVFGAGLETSSRAVDLLRVDPSAADHFKVRRIAPTSYQPDKGADQLLIQPAAGGILTKHLAGARGRQGSAIGTCGREGVEDVDHGDDLGQERNLLRSKAIGISTAIEPFVMVSDDRPDPRERLEAPAELCTDHRTA